MNAKNPFRGFSAILYKEFIVVLRDPMTLFFMFFPPLMQMIAFGFALDNDVKHMAMVVLNEDRTVESRQLIDQLCEHADLSRGRARCSSVDGTGRRHPPGQGLRRPANPARISRATCTPAAPRSVQVLIDGSNSTTASSGPEHGAEPRRSGNRSLDACCRAPGGATCPSRCARRCFTTRRCAARIFLCRASSALVLQIATMFATAMSLGARARTRHAGAIARQPAVALGTDARQTHAVSVHRHDDGRRRCSPSCAGSSTCRLPASLTALFVATLLLRLRAAEPGPADLHPGAKPDAGACK